MKVTIATQIDMDIRLVSMKDRPVQETITAAYKTSVNSIIKEKDDLIHNPGSRHMGVWRPHQTITSENIEEVMKSIITIIDGKTYKGRPATIEELASYEAIFYEELKGTTLIALGERVSDSSREYVAYRGVDGPKCVLNLNDWTHGWGLYTHVLIVFEKVAE